MATLVIVTGYTSINAIIKAEMFPAHIRALGVALPFAIANAIFGGTAEYVALYLKNIGHERWFYIYISALAAMSLIAYVRMVQGDGGGSVAGDDCQPRVITLNQAAEQGRNAQRKLRLGFGAVGKTGAIGGVNDGRIGQ